MRPLVQILTWTLEKASDNAGAGSVDVDYPEARAQAVGTMVSDSELVWALGQASSARNDVWKFNLNSKAWSLLKGEDNASVGSAGTDYPQARYAAAAGHISGSLYVTAGTTGSTLFNDVWRFDLTANAWSLAFQNDNASSGLSNRDFPARRSHLIAATFNNSLLVVGGIDLYLQDRNDVWSFAVSNNSWSLNRADLMAGQEAPINSVAYPYARRQFGFASNGSESVYLFGGQAASGVDNDVWQYSLDIDKWRLLKASDNAGVGTVNTNYPIKRAGSAMVFGSNKLYVFGGIQSNFSTYRNDVWAFDLSDNSWTLLKADDNAGSGTVQVNFPSRRRNPALSYYNNQLFLIGGYDNTFTYRNDVWAFNLDSNSWSLVLADNNGGVGSQGVNYPQARRDMTSAVNSTGEIILFGGLGASSAKFNDVWMFSTQTPGWTRLKGANNDGVGSHSVDYPRARNSSAGGIIDGQLLVFGGQDVATNYTNDIWAFDLSNLTWSLIRATNNASQGTVGVDYPVGRLDSVGAVTSRGLTVFGGFGSGSSYFGDLWTLNTVGGSAVDPYASILIGADLTPATGAIKDNENIKINLQAVGSGDSSGSTAHGVALWVWNASGNEFVNAANLTGSTLAANTLTDLEVPTSYLDSSKRMFLLLKNQNPCTAAVTCTLDINLSAFDFEVPYTD